MDAAVAGTPSTRFRPTRSYTNPRDVTLLDPKLGGERRQGAMFGRPSALRRPSCRRVLHWTRLVVVDRPRRCLVSRGSAAAQQGPALPRRSPTHRRDHRGHALLRNPAARRPSSRPDRYPPARRAANPRSAPTERARPRPVPRIGPRSPRQGRTPPRSRHGRLGLRAARTVAASESHDARRAAVLRHRRPFPRTRLGTVARARRAETTHRARRSPPPLRTPSATPRARHRARPQGVPLNVIQRQPGHRNLGVTSIYLQGIDPGEIIDTVHNRRPPMIPASAGLALPVLGPS
jgi:hypothetical protein